jgi:hypothetical protein
MQTDYKCAQCGTRIQIETQGDLPPGITAIARDSVNIGGKDYPLKNEKGESLKNVLNGVAEYWTPPPIPTPEEAAKLAPAPAS